MSHFDLCIGIDYSGAETPTSRRKELQVYAAEPGGMPDPVKTPAIASFLATGSKNPQSVPRYWTRNEIAHWLIGLARDGVGAAPYTHYHADYNAGSTNTIYSGGDKQSYLLLPIIPAK